ncbi:MAG: diguanylate cyclase [Lachnospirales bacterium]
MKNFKDLFVGYKVLYSNKFLILIAINIIYIFFAYNYEYSALKDESDYLVTSLSKQVSYSVTKISDYLKSNASYYNNTFLFEAPEEHYLVNNIIWNTENFYSLDNLNSVTGNDIYDFGNLTGFGTRDDAENSIDEISTILYANEIYKDFYNGNKESITNLYYLSENGFSYVYPYMLSKGFSYSDLSVQHKDLNYSTVNGISWGEVFLDDTTGNLTTSIFKDIYDVANNVETKVGVLGVNLVMPELTLLEDYSYYIVDKEFDILATNNVEVLESDGVKKFYDIKGTFENSSLIESILNEEQLFPYKDEIFSSQNIDDTPYYLIISKEKYEMLDHLYFLVAASLFVIFTAIFVLGEHDLRIFANKKKVKEIDKTKLRISRLKKENLIDSITDRYNKGALIEHSKYLYEQRQNYAIIIVEVEQFRNFNESYGRNVGDYQLKYVASIIQDCVGKEAFLGRWSGAKFMFMLENYEMRDVLNICDNIRNVIEESFFTVENDICGRFTVSCGVAEQQYETGMNYEDTLNNVNLAVIEAKSKARNKTVVYK